MGSEKNFIKEIVYTENQIKESVKKLSIELNAKFKKSNDSVIVITILKGGAMFSFELIKNLNFDLKLEFIKSKSYFLSKKTNSPKIKLSLEEKIKNKDVLIIDDVLDSGETLNKVIRKLKSRKPKSVCAVVLIDKNKKNKFDFKLFSCWKRTSNDFLIGYGLDYDEKYRNLPYIAIIKKIWLKD